MKTGKRKNNGKLGFFTLLMAALGLGGCETLNDAELQVERTFRAAYGVPTASYSVKGKVVDNSNRPVKGLQVILGNYMPNSASVIYDQNYFPIDTLETGSDGSFQYKCQDHFPIDQLQVDVRDIDGAAGGGEFENATLFVRDIDYKNAKGWYRGHADITVPKITVKKK